MEWLEGNVDVMMDWSAELPALSPIELLRVYLKK
jgi:hypothetical protein